MSGIRTGATGDADTGCRGQLFARVGGVQVKEIVRHWEKGRRRSCPRRNARDCGMRAGAAGKAADCSAGALGAGSGL